MAAPPKTSTIAAIEAKEQKRRQVIREELEQKLELEEKAHKIVERLLDDQIEEEFLIDCARFMLSDHYKDVVEERAIAKQCGYPVCDNVLGPTPKKQYHISMKSNKVYDITDRKCFCSNQCYKTSKYYASQISTVPLWMRDKDDPNLIKLLSSMESGNTSLPIQVGSGEEVILTEWIVPNDVENKSGMNETKSKETAVRELSDDLMSIKFFQDESEHLEQLVVKDNKSEDEDNNISDDESNIKDEAVVKDKRAVADVERENSDSKTSNKIEKVEPLKIEKAEPPTTKHIKKEQADLKQRKSYRPKQIVNILKLVTDCLLQWRTERTLQYLNSGCYEHDANKPSCLATDIKQTAMPINVEPSGSASSTAANPIDEVQKPDDGKRDDAGEMSESKAAGSLTEQRMRAMEDEAYKIRVENLFYGKKSTDVSVKKKKDIEENIPDSKHVAMPYVDSQSQMAIRRKIMLDRLNKAFSEFLGPLRLSIREFSSDLTSLVQTFHLGNKNMSFRPVGWTLLAIIILNMLGRKNKVVLSAITSQNGVNILSAILKKVNVEYREFNDFVELFCTREGESKNMLK